MEHHNCILDINKIVSSTCESIIHNICKDLNVDDEKTKELLKKYVSSDIGKLKQKKHPNLPKRPKTSYMFFCDSERQNIMNNNQSAKIGDISKILGEKWAKIDEKEKEKFIQLAEEAKEEYNEALKTFHCEN